MAHKPRLIFVFVAIALACAIAETRAAEFSECNRVQMLGLNESFEFSSFPPSSASLYGYGHKPFHYNYRHSGPQECTWLFKTKSGSSCQLHFRAGEFYRGDVNCDEQYFLIGDENGEKRSVNWLK